MLSNPREIKLEFHNIIISGKFPNIWKSNSTLLNDKDEIKMKIRKYSY